eukprot:Amastigsp_a679531_94.p2 type:complete len:171 gc:universal Amastigsp_a679531_94:173-685(+)
MHPRERVPEYPNREQKRQKLPNRHHERGSQSGRRRKGQVHTADADVLCDHVDPEDRPERRHIEPKQRHRRRRREHGDVVRDVGEGKTENRQREQVRVKHDLVRRVLSEFVLCDLLGNTEERREHHHHEQERHPHEPSEQIELIGLGRRLFDIHSELDGRGLGPRGLESDD